MARVVKGSLEGLELQPGGTLNVNREGVATAREVFRGNYSDAVLNSPKLNDEHPDFSGLLLHSKSVVREKAGLGRVECDYRGLDPAEASNPEELPPPVYSLSLTTGEEPIATHPNFDSIVDAAGGFETGKAIKDSDGFFKGFGPDSNGNLAGVSSYLAPSMTWNKSFVSLNQPASIGNVGSIESPEGGAPSLPSGYNWLYTGMDFTEQGGVYQVSQSWLASGPGGWNSNIYS